MMLEKTGIATKEMIEEVFPDIDRINKGPVAVIECFQNIPCNPCQTSCKHHAINIGEDINNTPHVDRDLCIGCGICLSRCPGLAIMILDGSKDSDTVNMRIPYEFLPLPTKGEIVKGLDREGQFVDNVKVVDVLNTKALDRTSIITIEVNREYLYNIRNIKVEDK